MKSGVTALAYETIEVNRRLPLLEPMSEIAGRMSMLVGGYFLGETFWRQRRAARRACRVCCRERWSSSAAALRASMPRAWPQGMGADVTILEVDLETDALSGYHAAHGAYPLLQ